jgi:hypothetical protein
MSWIDSRHRKISTALHFQNGRHNVTELRATLLIKYINYFTICLCYLKLTVYSNFKFSLVSTGLHFQNGYHNAAKIQHCSISKVTFDLFTNILSAVGLLSTGNRKHIIFCCCFMLYTKIFRCQESIQDIIIYLHMKCRWNQTMLNLCSIVEVILKMATGRNFSMSGINSGYHNLPTYEMSSYINVDNF